MNMLTGLARCEFDCNVLVWELTNLPNRLISHRQRRTHINPILITSSADTSAIPEVSIRSGSGDLIPS